MWIAVGNSVNGKTGTGTGGGGRLAPTFLTESTTGFTIYFGIFISVPQPPFTVHWGDGSSTEVSTGNSVSHSYSGAAQQYEVSLSGGPVFLYNDARFGINTWIDTVYRFDTLGFGNSTFKNLSPTMSGVTTTPGAFDVGVSLNFSPGTSSPAPIVLPNNIGDWDVSNVDEFADVFSNVTPSSLGSQPASWTFKNNCVWEYATFLNMTDANVAACLVGWESNSNQGTGVAMNNPFNSRTVVGGRTLSQSTYPAAKTAYDNLLSTYSWTDTDAINWVV